MRKYILYFIIFVNCINAQNPINVPASKINIFANYNFKNSSGIYNTTLYNSDFEPITNAQMIAFTNPKVGKIIRNTTDLEYYFYNGTTWKCMTCSSSGNSSWLLSGNTGTNPTVDYLGTSDLKDLVFRTNNAERFRIKSNTDSFNKIAYITNGDLNVNELTIGKGNNNIVTNTSLGVKSLYSNTTGLRNVGVGYNALYSHLDGDNNVGVGYNSLYSNTSGDNNLALGFESLKNNTTGNSNVAIGASSMFTNVSGINNVANGSQSLYFGTGNNNTAIGTFALYNITTGAGNTALGSNAGRSITAGTENTNSTNSIYIGFNSKASAINRSNEIVIGFNAEGNGSNTVTLGATTITNTYLRGAIRLTPLAIAPASPTAGTIYYDSITNKLRCWNGTTWNDLF